MIENLFADYLENPLPEIHIAYDTMAAALQAKGIDVNDVDDEDVREYTYAMEYAAFKAGFAAALELMQEAAAARR